MPIGITPNDVKLTRRHLETSSGTGALGNRLNQKKAGFREGGPIAVARPHGFRPSTGLSARTTFCLYLRTHPIAADLISCISTSMNDPPVLNFRSCASAVREAERKCRVHFGRPAKAAGANCFATFACSELWATHRVTLSCCRAGRHARNMSSSALMTWKPTFQITSPVLLRSERPILTPGTNGHERRCGRRSVLTIYPQIKVGYSGMEIQFRTEVRKSGG
jgi:hypothetical protein